MRRKLVRNQMTRIIGITGGIGSGKSTLARCFAEQGIPVFDADAIARTALTPSSDCFAKALALFGDEAKNADGTANRAAIAQAVFADHALLNRLNAIIHPYVIRTMLHDSQASGQPITVWDVPLLFESGCDAFCACTVAVLCSEEIRIARVTKRDGITAEQVRARMDQQLTDEQREALATFTIRNEDSEEAFCEKAKELIALIRKELL